MTSGRRDCQYYTSSWVIKIGIHILSTGHPNASIMQEPFFIHVALLLVLLIINTKDIDADHRFILLWNFEYFGLRNMTVYSWHDWLWTVGHSAGVNLSDIYGGNRPVSLQFDNFVYSFSPFVCLNVSFYNSNESNELVNWLAGSQEPWGSWGGFRCSRYSNTKHLW